MRRSVIPLLALVPLFACAPEPEPANPALWHVECPENRHAYLFGTVHALDRPAQWRGKAVDRAWTDAHLLLVEIIPHKDPKAQAEPFARLSKSAGHGPLTARLPTEQRPALAQLLAKNGLSDKQFDKIETWAAALMIAQAETDHLNSAYGIDRSVLKAAGEKPVQELEGTEPQLRIFDGLPESEQRDLLSVIVRDASANPDEAADLAHAWRTGDMATITKETERGMLADPELRQALFTGRNQRWTTRILSAMQQGHRPFVAVGAAHMAGPEGLPALLESKGCKVTRTQ